MVSGEIPSEEDLFVSLAAAILAIPLAAADAAAGKALFTQKCKSCHGAEGDGNPAIAKAMKVTLNPLSGKEVQSKSDADLRKVITAGMGKMKAVASMSEAQAGDVVAFIRTLKK